MQANDPDPIEAAAFAVTTGTRSAPATPIRFGGWQLWIGAIFSLGFIFLVLRDVHLADVANALSQVNPGLMLLAVASFVVTGVAKAARWRMLFALRQKPSLGRAFSVLSIAIMLNSFAPARLGELARAYLIGEDGVNSKTYALGTIAVEKVSDLIFLVLTLSLLLSQMALPDWLAGPARATALVIAVLVPLFLLLAWQNQLVLRALRRISGRLSRGWGEWLFEVLRGLESLQVLRHPRLLLGLTAWSALILVLGASTNYIVFAALGLNLSVWAALLLLVVLQVGVAVPSSPGRIGVFHYLVVLALSIFGIAKEIALGYSVVLYLVVYVPIAVIGGYCLWREKVTWQKLAEAAAALNRLGRKAQ
ncbi:MAG: flippase-like domain-containing protein [Chloroflexota bacterium]|nr:flippase-like domain-containing protein [Chloroflexota bacterium]